MLIHKCGHVYDGKIINIETSISVYILSNKTQFRCIGAHHSGNTETHAIPARKSIVDDIFQKDVPNDRYAKTYLDCQGFNMLMEELLQYSRS